MRQETHAPWRAYGRALRRALEQHLDVVLSAPDYRCGWTDGGCFVAAHAVAHLVGGDLWVVTSTSTRPLPHGDRVDDQAEHVVVRTPDGAGFLDADGFATERGLLTRWRKLLETRYDQPSIGLRPAAPERHTAERLHLPAKPLRHSLVCDLSLASDLEQRLRRDLPLSPGEKRRRNSLGEVGAAALALGALLPIIPPPGPGDILDPLILGGAAEAIAHRHPNRAARHRRGRT